MPDHDTFVHRYNADSTTDSICLKCFQAIGTEKADGDLASIEQIHRCNVVVLHPGSVREAPVVTHMRGVMPFVLKRIIMKDDRFR
jgi:hypothetical protein